MGCVALAGSLLGALWWFLAPVIQLTPDGAGFVARPQEFQVAQDGWFAVLTAGMGIIAATAVSLRPGRRPLVRALGGLGIVAAAGVVAAVVGRWLGPAPLADQLAAGVMRPSTPLQLHAAAVLLVGPVLFCIARCLAAVLGSDSGRRPSR
ncbi:MAG: hypothetical protein ACRC35_07555 [Angustibacter sp.]